MKKAIFFLVAAMGFIQCKQGPSPEEFRDIVDRAVQDSLDQIEQEEQENAVCIFKSVDMGVNEYMKSVDLENGHREWYYYTDKNPKEIQLGVVVLNGLESVYFVRNPKVKYQIGGSECGFTLMTDSESQWYQQIEPTCSLKDDGY